MIPPLIFLFLLLSVDVSLTTAAGLMRTDELVTSIENNNNETTTEPWEELETENKTDSTHVLYVGFTFNTTTVTDGYEPIVDSIAIPEGSAHLNPNLTSGLPADSTELTINSSLVDPGIIPPDSSYPEITSTDISYTEITNQGSLYPENTIPDILRPEITSPDSLYPEITTPDVSFPEVTNQASLYPENTIPGLSHPEITSPGSLFPEITSLVNSYPETVPLVSSYPEITSPGNSTLEIWTPSLSPEDTTPQTSFSENTSESLPLNSVLPDTFPNLISPNTEESIDEDTTPPTIEDTSPSTENTSPSTENTSPSTEDKSPVTEDTSPVTEDTSPVTEDISPVTEDTSPVTEDTSPITEETSPLTEDTTSPITEDTSTAEATSTTEDTTSPTTFPTESSTSEVSTEPPDDGVNVGLVIGIILAILLIGVGIVLWRGYRSGRHLWPPKNLFSNGTADSVRPQPVPLKKFPAHCSEMLEVPSKISHEFQLLATLSVDLYAMESFVAGQMPDNKYKNRYVNILPFDSTRVKLSPEGDGEFYSDYVNASYVKGYTNDIEYIATQGPKEETCRDFWKMVYQEPIKVIVMVTQLEEQGKPKCYKYFPNFRENMELEDIVVWCSAEVNFPIYTSRTLILTKGERKRSITHLHFREWPDFGCPATPELMLQFCQVMRHNIISQQPGITLIHCSAGVGRTGTLIAVDILLQHIKENKKIDIFGTVYKLRKHRMNMVQTEGQYVYIYKCIKEALEDPSYLSSENSSTTSLEPIYENIECARLTSVPSKEVLDTVTNENECAL